MMLIKFYKRQGDKIKMWGGDPGLLATGSAHAEMMRELGASLPLAGVERIGRDHANVVEVVGNWGMGKW